MFAATSEQFSVQQKKLRNKDKIQHAWISTSLKHKKLG